MYSLSVVPAAYVCAKSILKRNPMASALLAGASYTALNIYEEIEIPGWHQKGHPRGNEESRRVATDLEDFSSGIAGTAVTTATLLFLNSKLRLDLLCK